MAPTTKTLVRNAISVRRSVRNAVATVGPANHANKSRFSLAITMAFPRSHANRVSRVAKVVSNRAEIVLGIPFPPVHPNQRPRRAAFSVG
jgi:hypothetical protein